MERDDGQDREMTGGVDPCGRDVGGGREREGQEQGRRCRRLRC